MLDTNHTKHHFLIILKTHKWYFYPRLHYSQKKKLHFYHIIKGRFCTNAHFEDGHEPLYVDGMELLSVTVKRNSPSTNESSHYVGKIIILFILSRDKMYILKITAYHGAIK